MELLPSCRFFPTQTSDVRDGLAIIVSQNTSFAIVSGGHSGKTSASNIDDPGVTIDLSSLKDISLIEEGELVQVGPGASWSEVYAFLEPHGLTVAGSRDGHVGAGGFVLGGGLSWFSSQVGWSCDTVLEFELVTPDGRILLVNTSSHPELFEAAKGSLGTFGVVTRFTMRPIRTAQAIYGGALVYDREEVPELFKALALMGHAIDGDPFSHSYVSIGYMQSSRSFSYVAYVVNTLADRLAPGLVSFQQIRHPFDDLKCTTIRQSADDLTDMDLSGFRRIKFTLTALLTTDVMEILHQTFCGAAERLNFDPEGILGMMYQPLSLGHVRGRGNIFTERLTQLHGPLLLVSVELWWQDAQKDGVFETEAEALHAAIDSQLRDMEALHPWIYPNYAARWQAPFGSNSLGSDTVDRLRRVRQRYDPDDVWRRLVPGMW